jgi:hypothetical protein
MEAGSEWKTGLAWAIIGGLISSLLLTLVLVPVVYTKVDEWKETLPAFVMRLLAKRKRLGTRDAEPELVHQLVVVSTEVSEAVSAANVNGNGGK